MQSHTKYIVLTDTGKVIHTGKSLKLALRVIRAAVAFGIPAHIHTFQSGGAA